MSKPGVSCQCASYGRLELLNEAVECFLRQDYEGPKELLILNDLGKVELKLDHPEVSIVNCPIRYSTLGAKLNAMAALSRYDILMPWPDDDIHLPWAISTAVEKLGDKPYFCPKGYWSMSGKELGEAVRYGALPGLGVFTRELSYKAHYPHMNSGQDQVFRNNVRGQGAYCVIELTPEEAYFIYRWATGHYHLSGYGKGNSGWETIRKSVEARHEPGVYEIVPNWKQDYSGLVRERYIV